MKTSTLPRYISLKLRGRVDTELIYRINFEIFSNILFRKFLELLYKIVDKAPM